MNPKQLIPTIIGSSPVVLSSASAEQIAHGVLKFVEEAQSALRRELVEKKYQLEEQAEIHCMQIAAICTRSKQNTHTSLHGTIIQGHPYWTPAYAVVAEAVDREVAHRESAERLLEQNHELKKERDRLEGICRRFEAQVARGATPDEVAAFRNRISELEKELAAPKPAPFEEWVAAKGITDKATINFCFDAWEAAKSL